MPAPKPLLSICIPTYNRADILKITLEKITSQRIFQDTCLVEIVISDNSSTDHTESVAQAYVEKYPDKVRYFRQTSNIQDRNFTSILERSNGVFSKLNNDYLFFDEGNLAKFVEFVQNHQDAEVIFIPCNDHGEDAVRTCKGFNELLDAVSYDVTFIGSLCVKSETYRKIEDPNEYDYLHFCQVDILAKLLEQQGRSYVYPTMQSSTAIPNKGGYSIPEVFGKNFLTLLQILQNKNLVTENVYRKVKKEILVKHINWFCFKKYKHSFTSTGYFRYLLPLYKKNPYFYLSYINNIAKLLLKKLFTIRKVNGKKKIILCGKIINHEK